MKANKYAQVAAIVFTIVAILHLLRAVTGGELRILSWNAEPWISGIAAIILMVLAYFGFTVEKKN